MRLQIVLLLVGVAYTCCGNVDHDDDIKVRIRVKGKPESKTVYMSLVPGENLKLICELISANHSATDDRLEWTKTGILRTNIEDLSDTDGSDDNVETPIDAKQKGNSSVVTFKSLSEHDSGTHRCTSRKYGKTDFILVLGAKPIKVDLSDIFRPKGNFWKPIKWGGADEEGIITRGGAEDKDKPIVNMGGAIDTPVANWSHLTNDELEKSFSTLWKTHFDCSNHDFSCASDGKCIKFHKVCDGSWDCEDGSDESILECETDSCAGKMRCDDGTCVSRDDCALSSLLCCPEDNTRVRYKINYESPKYESSNFKSNYVKVFVVGLLACVMVAIRYCILVLCSRLRMGTSSDHALLIQRTIVIRGPVGGDDVERGGVNNEGVPSNRGGASGEGEEPSNGLPAYSDVVATQAPPPSYANTVANPV